jgi:subtilisin family serine protease
MRPRLDAPALAALIALAGLLAVSAFAAAQAPAGEERSYIVTLRSSIQHPGHVGQAQVAHYGGRLGFVYRYGPIGYSATLPADAVGELRREPSVVEVIPDLITGEAAAQTASTGIKRVFAFANKALQIDEKNNHWVGADVAVIDAGFVKEKDLNLTRSVYCKLVGGIAACKEEETPDRTDEHGTAVASVLGAIDNEEGVVGVAPGVRLWSIKVLDDTGVKESVAIAAINWVTEHAEEIEVANMSIGCAGTGACTASGIKTAISAAVGAGVVFVVSAGNNNIDVSKNGYGNNPDAITASGIADYDGKPEFGAKALWSPSCSAEKLKEGEETLGKDDERYVNSNWGELVDVTAPAVCIRTLKKGGGLAYWSGTSFAAPEVAGAAAILAEHENPETLSDVTEIRETIRGSGNFGWVDTSADGFWEPLLDMHDEAIFK